MSLQDRNRRRIASSLLMVLMFLFADLSVPSAISQWQDEQLEEPQTVYQTTSSFSASKDTAIDSANPNTNYGMDETADLGLTLFGESRILISFNNSVPAGDLVNSATLDMTCGVDPLTIGTINIYTARLKRAWNESNADWNSPDTGTNWGLNGADESSDRGLWEPPFHGYGNNTFSINVTAIVQEAVRNSRNSIDILVTATGTSYNCHMSESVTTSSRPSLEVTHTNGTHTNGGSLNPNFVEDGAALMNSDSFILSAATNPTLSWDSSTGVDAQVQLSVSPQFKSDADDTWFYNTKDNSSLFTISSGSGEMQVPTGDELSNSTTMYYRMRAVDSTDTIGAWQSGYFHLPGHSVSEVNGYGQFTFSFDDLGLVDKTIEDSFIGSSNALKNTNFGQEGNITVGSSPTLDQYGLMRVNLDDVGLHTNATIISASLVMERSSYSGTADVSMHIMDSEEWTETGVTWRKYDGTYYWDDGGRSPSMSVGAFEGDQSSSTIETDITAALQKWIDDNRDAIQSGNSPEKDMEIMMVASTFGIEESTTQSVNLCSTEALSCNQPYLDITYGWDNTGAPTIPTHISPQDGHSVWNLSGDNLSGNTMPTLSWDGTISWTGDMLMQVSTDQEYRNIIHSFNTSTTSEFSETDGNWSISSTDALQTGVMYHWRLAQVDSTDYHHSWWSTSSFLVSGLESEHLQDDEHRLRLSHGNATTAGDAPNCMDTYIDSGTPTNNYNGEEEMQISYNTFPSETSILLGCDLTSHLLPSGYAVKTSNLKLRLADYPSGSPVVGVWESRQHNWTEDSATWSSFDGTNSWGTSGAKGWERAGLLDSVTLDNSFSAGDWVDFDISLAVQNAMREDRSVDLIIGILGVGSGSNRDALFYPNNANSANRPEISFVYVPGSDALPSEPVPVTPTNGSWAVETGINIAPDTTPSLTWNFSASGVTVGGYSVEMDTTSTFDSPNLIIATSWTDTGFDINNQTYDGSGTALETGNTWYWRVRATSSTNQIGNWSDTFHFLLPDLTTWSIDSNTAAVELHHREAMPSLNLPNFIDTWVASSGVGATADQSSSATFRVGTNSTGASATSLMKIPLTELPNPQNAHVSRAMLHLYAQFGSSEDNAVSVHASAVPWNTSANGTTYDGVNNWTLAGGLSPQDRGEMVDISQGVSADWMTFDVTELVQSAFANGDSHLTLTIVGSSGEGQTIFTSTAGLSGERPWLNLTWTSGAASSPESAGNNANPATNEIIWNTTGHALLPGETPTFTWTHSNQSNVDNWRLFLWNDYSDEREGWQVFDSREDSSGWDITNLSWTPQTSLGNGESFEWFTQPISNNILGARSSDTIFHIPEETGSRINATDAEISLQEGQIVEALDYPAVFMDSYIDQGSTNSGFESLDRMIVGLSNYSSSPNFQSYSMIKVNWSDMPIPGSHEFVNATLTLAKLSGGESNQEEIKIAVCEAHVDWNENVTFNSPNGTSTSWPTQPCDDTFEVASVSYDDLTVEFDVTYAVQHAHASGLDKINLFFRVVDENLSITDEWHFASSDYTADESKRPELSLTWRTGTQWLPSKPTGLLPLDGSTIWNESSSRPRGADSITFNWTAGESNETRWIGQLSADSTFASENSTIEVDFTDNTTFNGTWDLTNLTFVTDSTEAADGWVYWRVRAEQGHRLGKWSDSHSYRVPGEIGSDDGDGNNTVTLYDGSVFENTGRLPGVPDSTIDSNRANTALGENGELDLGISSGGSGESKIILTFDLSELPFPSAMTPTSALLSLYRNNVSGTSSLTVSAHACDTFDESSVTWNNAPSCSANEITRSTMLVVPTNGWQIWDITSLAQSNVANGNTTMTVMLQAVGTPGSGHSFYDNSASSSFRPKLILEYVDNVDGIIPPGQPVLNYPSDGEILYNTSTWELTSQDKPQLTWNPVTNATGYIVTIANTDGQQKYKSWEDSEINGTTFTFSQNLISGEVYNWWVQAINETIPGPSSSRRAFAIGSPVDHSYNGDNTWTYTFQTGNEVADLGHTNIRDSYIGSGFSNMNHGSESMMVGTNCEGANTECRMIFALDNSQIPLPLGAKVHSAAAHFEVEAQASGTMTLHVHRLLTSAWTQAGSTWDNSEAGVPWSAGGLAAGVDYDATPISSTTIGSGTTSVWLDIGHAGMTMNGDHMWIVIATTPAGSPSFVEFYSSENALDNRPKIVVNYTDVHTVSISPSGSTTDADTTVQFSHILNDAQGGGVSQDVIWSTDDGTISTTGVYTPQFVGTHNITACFGVICTTESITVTPGLPVTLVVEQTTASITADESFTINAEIQDQHGNTVPGLTITYNPSNGSMNGATFLPYASGLQEVDVKWNGQSIKVLIEVLGGVPTNYVTTGCEDVIHAGTTCQLTWTLHDQFGNMLELEVGGGITWTAGGGVFTEENGTYFAMTVGSHQITMLSTGGISHTIPIEVTHGEIASLEIIASETFVTADDIVWLNTTRIDIMGNRLSVVIPQENWTVSDGMITAGQPAEWHAQRRGSKTLTASYAGTESSVIIQVSEGAITDLVLVIDSVDSTYSLQELTADEEITVKVKAIDSDGNRWTEPVSWTIEHPQFNDQSVLQEMTYGSTTMFVPVFASETAYVLKATYVDENITLEVSLNILVDHGELVKVTLIQPSNLNQNIDADKSLTFIPQLTDGDENIIDPSIITYTLIDVDQNVATDITDTIVANGGVWEASTVGNWTITAWAISESGYNISETVTISVGNGEAVTVDIDVIANTAKAGQTYTLTITGTDSDGNTFLESVLWTKDNAAVPPTTIEGTGGVYNWSASTAGQHTYKFRSPSGAENFWTVDVSPHQTVDRIEFEIVEDSVLQLESFEISVRTFDAWDNEIPVPPETQVKLTGRMTAKAGDNGQWTITTLDDEEQTVTIAVHNKEKSDTILVEGTFMGFFEAGGTLYYAGGVLAILIVLVLLVVIIMVLRSGGSEYDDEDDDDDYEYEEDQERAIGPGPGGPPQSPAPYKPPKPDWAVDFRIDDEDGTAWAEADDGTWYYWDNGISDWSEWAD